MKGPVSRREKSYAPFSMIKIDRTRRDPQERAKDDAKKLGKHGH